MQTNNLSTLKIHKLSRAQYDREKAAGNIDDTALYLTPDDDMNIYATKEELSNIPNLHVWKKYSGNSNTIIETDVTNQQIAASVNTTSYGNTSYTLQYADEITIQDGVISLVEPTSLIVGGETGTPSDFNVILGKYIYGGSLLSKGFFYIPADATITIAASRISVYASSAKKITKPTALSFVSSMDSNAYPTSGEHTDGYWYEYCKQLGDVYSGSEISGDISELFAAVSEIKAFLGI